MSTTGLVQGLGSHVYSALDKLDPNGRREWLSIASFGPTRVPDIKELAKRVTIAPEFLEHARDSFERGRRLSSLTCVSAARPAAGPTSTF
jgi:hypothetical protein